MTHPCENHLDMVSETVGQVLGMAAVIRERGRRKSDRRIRRDAVKVGLRASDMVMRVRGNRPPELPLTWDDLRLVLAAALREGLRELGEAER